MEDMKKELDKVLEETVRAQEELRELRKQTRWFTIMQMGIRMCKAEFVC